MGDGLQILDIIVFAVIAGFLVLRLRSVLGRRTGTERRRDPFRPPVPPPETAADKVVPLPPARGRTVAPPAASGTTSLAAGLERLKAADRSFDEKAFLAGARGAFEIIVNAFAKGDTASLQPLLSEQVFASFSAAIRARAEAHETLETNLISIKSVDLVAAELNGDTALVTVKFVSDQTNAVRAHDGSVVEGNPDHVEEKIDLWTFARSIRSRDPNWTLVATHSP
jgi:predicted lipid-binding transport protein (Tim44 family)